MCAQLMALLDGADAVDRESGRVVLTSDMDSSLSEDGQQRARESIFERIEARAPSPPRLQCLQEPPPCAVTMQTAEAYRIEIKLPGVHIGGCMAPAHQSCGAEGDIVETTITNITEFGAFCQVQGLNGMIHLSEIAWKHLKHPQEVLEVGQQVQACITFKDQKKQRLSLSMKRLLPDPLLQSMDVLADAAERGEVKLLEGDMEDVPEVCRLLAMQEGVEAVICAKHFATETHSPAFQSCDLT
eukprot:gene8595-10207_t